jgi:electron transfer flavoprotein alpha subunit
MPRVAALLDVMVISDASGVVDADTFERPIYAGNAIQTVKSSDAKKVVTFRTSTFDAAGTGGSAPVERPIAPPRPGLSRMGRGQGGGKRPARADLAGIVVSGGRAASAPKSSSR